MKLPPLFNKEEAVKESINFIIRSELVEDFIDDLCAERSNY